jgi:enoyl-CoA hydratase/carnithine racemase
MRSRRKRRPHPGLARPPLGGPGTCDGDAGMPEARRIVFRMLECDKPIIARVNGHAVGLGAMIALLCDIIIAAEDAKIGSSKRSSDPST